MTSFNRPAKSAPCAAIQPSNGPWKRSMSGRSAWSILYESTENSTQCQVTVSKPGPESASGNLPMPTAGSSAWTCPSVETSPGRSGRTTRAISAHTAGGVKYAWMSWRASGMGKPGGNLARAFLIPIPPQSEYAASVRRSSSVSGRGCASRSAASHMALMFASRRAAAVRCSTGAKGPWSASSFSASSFSAWPRALGGFQSGVARRRTSPTRASNPGPIIRTITSASCRAALRAQEREDSGSSSSACPAVPSSPGTGATSGADVDGAEGEARRRVPLRAAGTALRHGARRPRRQPVQQA